MTQNQKAICEKLGWRVEKQDDEIMLEKYSPLGEDFIFYVDKNNFVDNITEYANDFDADDHASLFISLRGNYGIPQSVRALIDDADAIKEMLMELSNALKNEEE